MSAAEGRERVYNSGPIVPSVRIISLAIASGNGRTEQAPMKKNPVKGERKQVVARAMIKGMPKPLSSTGVRCSARERQMAAARRINSLTVRRQFQYETAALDLAN